MMSSTSNHFPAALLTLSLAATAATSGCGDEGIETADDAGVMDGAVADGSVSDAGPCRLAGVHFSKDAVGAVPGVRRRLWLELDRDACRDAQFTLAADTPMVAEFPAMVTIPGSESRVPVEFTALAVGETTIIAQNTDDDLAASLAFTVRADGTPSSCEETAHGQLRAGTAVRIDTGAANGAGIALAEGASRDDDYQVRTFDAEVACAADQVPPGYRPLGPAIRMAPQYLRFTREIRLTIPTQLALLPSDADRRDVEVSYTGPGVTQPRIVAVASHHYDESVVGMLTFEAPRLGTYQAVVREAPVENDERTLTHRAVLGVSMGAAGAAAVLRHADRFDHMAVLGGPVDWLYLMNYVRTYFTGGFCNADQWERSASECARGSSLLRVPRSTTPYEHIQHFEEWWYDDRYGGQGQIFRRLDYMHMFLDLTQMFGNPNTNRTTDPREPNLTPPGVPDSERSRSQAERCGSPVVIPAYDGGPGTGYFDDEYNPDGAYPVITFCDGAERMVGGRLDAGNWDPSGTNDLPMSVTMAVDIDGNGRRDPGEPVIRAMWEVYDDCGLDRLCNADEEGYHAATNPDPAGDDYDFQYNPTGTEGNGQRDGATCDAEDGEAFLDAGLDGVVGTAQLDDGGFDDGEGNGCWDRASGLARMIERNPRHLIAAADDAAIRRLSILADGGIRDMMNFLLVTNHLMGGLAARDLPVQYFNAHSSLDYSGETNDEAFSGLRIRWDELGDRVMVRYGDPDASEELKRLGDGGHVGTSQQAINRFVAASSFFDARWPDGDRTRSTAPLCNDASCDERNPEIIDFMSPTTGRVGPVAILLPPGYHEHPEVSYPVVYVLHGYGMGPEDMVLLLSLLYWNQMTGPNLPTHQRIQKMIFVFPDGVCRGDECFIGTFFNDAPPGTPGGAASETFLMDVVDYVDETYRTLSP